MIADPAYFEACWKTGDDRRKCGGAFAHVFWPKETMALVREVGEEIVACAGLDGLNSNANEQVSRHARADAERWRVWLAAHEALCTHPAVFASSQHLLGVGRKPL